VVIFTIINYITPKPHFYLHVNYRYTIQCRYCIQQCLSMRVCVHKNGTSSCAAQLAAVYMVVCNNLQIQQILSEWRTFRLSSKFVGKSRSVRVQDYKSLHVVVMICTTNTGIHRQLWTTNTIRRRNCIVCSKTDQGPAESDTWCKQIQPLSRKKMLSGHRIHGVSLAISSDNQLAKNY